MEGRSLYFCISAPRWERVDVTVCGAVQLDQGALGRQDAVAGAGYDKEAKEATHLQSPSR
jgi:hypothetical protein